MSTVTSMNVVIKKSIIRNSITVSNIMADISKNKPKGQKAKNTKFMVFNATICQLYHGGQFHLWRKPEYQEKTTDQSQVTDKLRI